MMKFDFSEKARTQLADRIRDEIRGASGRKAMEFGTGCFSLAEALRGDLEYLGCTDRSDEALDAFRPTAEAMDIQLIPNSELSEDCYFGRFHLVYTLFGLHDLPHLVDEIMRLRRLIIKGGKIVIVDLGSDGFRENCVRQLKRCGFLSMTAADFELDGRPVFMISAEK